MENGWIGDGKCMKGGGEEGRNEDIGGQTEKKGRLGSERDIIYIL